MDDLSVGLSSGELLLLWMCVKYVEMHIPEAREKPTLASVLEKLSAAREEPDTPYDVAICLAVDEVHMIDSALHLMMADATIARKFGGPADELIGKTRISELAKFVPMMRDVLRRLHLGERLAVQERQIADLQTRVEQLERKND